MGVLQAVVSGLVQGLTEFLPISSTAHLRIVPALLGWADPGAAFSAIIQLGTSLAVILYFWTDLWRLAAAFAAGLASRRPWASFESSLPCFLIVGTPPISLPCL